MTIRLAHSTDIVPIMQLVRVLVPVMQANGNFQWNETYPNSEVFAEDIKQNQLWVAESDGTIAGVAAITTEQYPEYAQVGLDLSETAIVVHRLAVNPNAQGKGIAAALLQQAEQESIKRSINLLRIDTNKENSAAQNLFLKAGYEFKGEMTLEFRPGQKFVCFEKRLVK